MDGRTKIFLLIIQVVKKRKFYALIGLIYFFIFYDKDYINKYTKNLDNKHFRYIMD